MRPAGVPGRPRAIVGSVGQRLSTAWKMERTHPDNGRRWGVRINLYPQVMPKDFTHPAKVDRCTIVPTLMNGGTMMHKDEHGAQECTKVHRCAKRRTSKLWHKDARGCTRQASSRTVNENGHRQAKPQCHMCPTMIKCASRTRTYGRRNIRSPSKHIHVLLA